MELVILVVQIFLALAIIGVVLLQPPESSGLGGLGGSNPMAGVAGRSQGNILTRATAILATLFIITSLTLAIMASHKPKADSILDQAAEMGAEAADKAAEAVPADKAVDKAAKAAKSIVPSVPLAKE